MKTLSALRFSIRSLFCRRAADAEIDEEIADHIARSAAMNEANGMSPSEARREAVRLFGGVQRYREESRDVRRLGWLDDLRADVRLSVRHVRRHPGFSASVISIAAVGITVCVSAFSIVSGVLLAPLPFPEPDRVMSVSLRTPNGDQYGRIPLAGYQRIEADSLYFESIASHEPARVTMTVGGHPEQMNVERITPSFFRVFGIAPILGRPFAADEADNTQYVVLLGNQFWRAELSGDPSVVGRRILLDGIDHTVIGVMPPQFQGTLTREPSLWLPMNAARSPSVLRSGSVNDPIARLRPGVSPKLAVAWIATTVDGLLPGSAYKNPAGSTGMISPVATRIYGDVERPLMILLAGVALVLLLVAANLATMFLARSSAREGELALRRALGAGRWRQLRQLVTESMVLTVAGSALGLVVSYWIVRSTRALGVLVIPRIDTVRLDWRVALFAAGVTILTGIAGGLVPAMLSRDRGHAARGGNATRRASSALVVVQVALSVVLLVGSGLLIKGFMRVLPSGDDMAIEHRMIVGLTLRDTIQFPKGNVEAGRRFTRQVIGRLRGVRGVADVAASITIPFSGLTWSTEADSPGRSGATKPVDVALNAVTPNYFDVLGLTITSGRAFTAADVAGSERVAIVNDNAAERLWPGQNAVGQTLVTTGASGAIHSRVVGVVRGTRLAAWDTKIRPEALFPLEQETVWRVTFVVKGSAATPSRTDLERAVWSVGPTLPIEEVSPFAVMASQSLQRVRFFSTALSIFAIAAVVLSALGVYGLLAFTVAQRRREIGIRMAIGARAGRIGAMVVVRGIVLGATGMAIGIVLARGLTRFMESQLHEVKPTDMTVFGIAAAGGVVVAALAACVPAWQAVRVDPVKSLRV